MEIKRLANSIRIKPVAVMCSIFIKFKLQIVTNKYNNGQGIFSVLRTYHEK